MLSVTPFIFIHVLLLAQDMKKQNTANKNIFSFTHSKEVLVPRQELAKLLLVELC